MEVVELTLFIQRQNFKEVVRRFEGEWIVLMLFDHGRVVHFSLAKDGASFPLAHNGRE